MKFGTIAEHEGYTSLSATLEWFERGLDDDNRDASFPFSSFEEAKSDAEIVADSAKCRVLIVESVNMTNTKVRGVAWITKEGREIRTN